MSEYVSTVTLEVNGQKITDFKTVTEKEVELHKAVNLMNHTGVMSTTPRYGVEVDYVIPKGVAEFDWRTLKDGTLTIDHQDGRRVTFSGVYPGKIGAAKYDSENEVVRTIDLVAVDRKES